ncbi:putative RNA-directed DNA polymerase from transposon X-element [Trichonephila inaurata madagascariensis]|uniref:Putative RNA-directed DNA polymerase from transposon X-element n=1 Tax=Trichonephila inaurata madagascariensis TaxID=2747483 RepID=A0A8X6MFF5_9ARAC|nr:putative RNA-directed DNA polymerase from transposon X-element [Trichonephila inaurata madagascariensis]
MKRLHTKINFSFLAVVHSTRFQNSKISVKLSADEGQNPKAIVKLKKCFGRDELLVQIYVRDLLSIVVRNAVGRSKIDLKELYDLLENKLIALKSLGHTKKSWLNFWSH